MATAPCWMKRVKESLVLSLWIQPGSKRTEIVGEFNGCLKIKVQAPPVDGSANKAIQIFLAKKLGLRQNQITLVSGAGNRRKTFEIQMLNCALAVERLVGEI